MVINIISSRDSGFPFIFVSMLWNLSEKERKKLNEQSAEPNRLNLHINWLTVGEMKPNHNCHIVFWRHQPVLGKPEKQEIPASKSLHFCYQYLRTRHSNTLFETLTPASHKIRRRLKLEVFPEWCRSNLRNAVWKETKYRSFIKYLLPMETDWENCFQVR